MGDSGMDVGRRLWIGLVLVGVVLVVGGIVWLFVALGAEDADRISSGIGAASGVLGLLLTAFASWKVHVKGANGSTHPGVRRQSVENSTVSGTNVQVGGSVSGGITVHNSRPTPVVGDGEPGE